MPLTEKQCQRDVADKELTMSCQGDVAGKELAMNCERDVADTKQNKNKNQKNHNELSR